MSWTALFDVLLLVLSLWKDASAEKRDAIKASLEAHHENITALRKAREAGDRTTWLRALRGIKRMPDED